MRRGGVAAAVRGWLRERELSGADEVRARMALALAAELDDKASPRYTRAKVSAELRALLAELDDAAPAAGDLDARRLLQEAWSWTRTS